MMLQKLFKAGVFPAVYCRYNIKTAVCFHSSSYDLLSSTYITRESKQIPKSEWIQFSSAKLGEFYQSKPKLSNPFLSDIPLQRFLKFHVPEEVSKEISADLHCFGSRIVHEINQLGWECENNLPTLSQDAWDCRVNKLVTCSAWKRQHDISAEEGLVAIGYERQLNEWSRLHQICKLYLYFPSSGLYSCPLAMTDGAAKTIEALGKNKTSLQKTFNNLISRDPVKFWTSGQWMTERKGGSDVASSTETVAVPEDDYYRLYGYKWFTSAADSDMALTLARESQDAETTKDVKGLTLFYLETKNSEGQLNNLHLMRLKNKLGTRQLPTAELLLDGTVAYKISKEGRGIADISNMLNITRLYNSIGAVAAMRRILMLARDYSQRRSAFGKTIAKLPLHMQALSRMEMETRGALIFLLKIAVLLGKAELNVASTDEKFLLNLLLPILKLYTAKQAIFVVSEGLESFGGQGYIEDTGIPVILRDAQVLPIWEGTTNIMSLDVLRNLQKTNFEVLHVLEQSIMSYLNTGKQNPELSDSCMKVKDSILFITQFVQNFPSVLNVAARDLSCSIARTYIGALLIEHASLSKLRIDITVAQRWCMLQDICPLSHHHTFSSYVKYAESDSEIVMDGYVQEQ